uniref:Chlorophyll a-b binding protein, chloroplastic n=1 Tax=Aegilops tauschii subsp. strangulata TaxID=200361 RepID=A0A453B7N6_AEGTS
NCRAHHRLNSTLTPRTRALAFPTTGTASERTGGTTMALVSSSSATAVAALPSNGLAGARSSFLGAAGKAAGSRASFAVRAAAPERPIWFPGSTPPPWLDGRLVTRTHCAHACRNMLRSTLDTDSVCVRLVVLDAAFPETSALTPGVLDPTRRACGGTCRRSWCTAGGRCWARRASSSRSS